MPGMISGPGAGKARQLPDHLRATRIGFKQARAREIRPEGDPDHPDPYVVIDRAEHGGSENVPYDFLINATGPRLRFDKTEGLGPDGHSLSVCTPEHAVGASAALDEAVERMRRGERQRFLVGTGHGTCTCEGAALEYIVNLEFELRARKVRDKAEITWITNEYALGDFGMGGMHLRRGGHVVPSNLFTESLFAERGVDWITRAHVQQGGRGPAYRYQTLDGARPRAGVSTSPCCCRPFSGVGLRAYGRERRGHHRPAVPAERLHAGRRRTTPPGRPGGGRPATGRAPASHPPTPNIFAAGIALAPPARDLRSRAPPPHTPPDGTSIASGPAPHRDALGRASARPSPASIADMVRGAAAADPHRVHGRDGRGLRSLRRRAPAHRHRRLDDRVPDRPRPRPLPAVRAAWTGRPVRSGWPGTGSRSCCTTCSCTRPGSVPAGPSSRSSDHGRKRSSCPAARPARCRVRGDRGYRALRHPAHPLDSVHADVRSLAAVAVRPHQPQDAPDHPRLPHLTRPRSVTELDPQVAALAGAGHHLPAECPHASSPASGRDRARGPEAAQPQAVGDHEDRAEGHRGAPRSSGSAARRPRAGCAATL